ncbi:MAG: Lrp/AsnC ligand binding domain-containing protein [Bacteroidota bacterium]
MAQTTQLDQLDFKILNILLEDARTPYLEIARSCEVSGATVHLRIQKLEKIGVIEGSHLTLNYKQLGLGVCAFLGLYLEKCDSFDDVFLALKDIPEIIECHYTTGEYALFLKVCCRDTDHLRVLLVEQIQKIPFVRRTETFLSLGQAFNRKPGLGYLQEEPALNGEVV